MEIVIEGWRAGGEERKEAARVPANELPALSDEQKLVAKKMGISEEDYARSAYAGKRSQERLIEKTRRFAELLQSKLQARSGVEVRRIRLDVLNHRYDVVVAREGREIPFRVSEEMIDDLFQSGSESLERDLERVLDYALPVRVA